MSKYSRSPDQWKAIWARLTQWKKMGKQPKKRLLQIRHLSEIVYTSTSPKLKNLQRRISKRTLGYDYSLRKRKVTLPLKEGFKTVKRDKADERLINKIFKAIKKHGRN